MRWVCAPCVGELAVVVVVDIGEAGVVGRQGGDGHEPGRHGRKVHQEHGRRTAQVDPRPDQHRDQQRPHLPPTKHLGLHTHEVGCPSDMYQESYGARPIFNA